MIAEISTGINAAQTGITILKGVKGIVDRAKMEVALSDLRECIAQTQESLLSAQQSIHTLTEEKSNLKKQITEFEEWKTQKNSYQLNQIREGLFIYVYTPLSEPTEESHWACPNCFSKKHISILQKIHSRASEYTCPSCNFEVSPKELPPVTVKGHSKRGGQYS